MSSYQYRESHCGDKTIFRPSYLHNGISYIGIKKSSYWYRKSHCGDKTILRPSYLHNGISYAGKMTYLYWIRALDTFPYKDFFFIHELLSNIVFTSVNGLNIGHIALYLFRHMDSHLSNKMLVRPSYFYNGTHILVRQVSLYWNRRVLLSK